MSEFGRTPGAISAKHAKAASTTSTFTAACSPAAASPAGAVIGKSDEMGGNIVDAGWSGGRAIYMEDIACTIYSALGIDWSKTVADTPSGRPYHYVEPASGTTYMDFQPVNELFA